MPLAGQTIALLSPLTYANDTIQYAYTGTTHFSPFVDAALLCAFILVYQFVANRLYRKFNE